MNTIFTGRLHRKCGTTMIETLLAVGILAVSIGGGTKMVAMTMKLSDLAKDKNTAINLAKNRIERISVSDFNDFSMWNGTNYLDARGVELPDPAESPFRIVTEVTPVLTNLAEVVIQVHSRNRVTREFDKVPETLVTQIADIQQTTP